MFAKRHGRIEYKFENVRFSRRHRSRFEKFQVERKNLVKWFIYNTDNNFPCEYNVCVCVWLLTKPTKRRLYNLLKIKIKYTPPILYE